MNSSPNLIQFCWKHHQNIFTYLPSWGYPDSMMRAMWFPALASGAVAGPKWFSESSVGPAAALDASGWYLMVLLPSALAAKKSAVLTQVHPEDPTTLKVCTKHQRVSYWPGSFLQDGVIGKVKPWDLNNVCRSRSAFRIDLQFPALRNDSDIRRCPTSSIALRAKRFTRLPLAWGGNVWVLLDRGRSTSGKVKHKTLTSHIIVFYEWYL